MRIKHITANPLGAAVFGDRRETKPVLEFAAKERETLLASILVLSRAAHAFRQEGQTAKARELEALAKAVEHANPCPCEG